MSLLWTRGLRKDKYNRKINKYHVEVEEGDSDLDEDMEREIKTSSKDWGDPGMFVPSPIDQNL